MPKRTDIHKVMVIGSGPIIIGQAAEFDYAGANTGPPVSVATACARREMWLDLGVMPH